ncbi:flagellar protein FlgN [Calderihabitans maritimus]|uniref:FlgN family protein n=1 Tax=Calderihabitans maritimus TaxID=1246530 RepID=A0A1Z5HU89_9FIRM|nr:flagellar protein FlgN [Calderihabitans maritimus]GAW92901.1 FlgN family protein [Calderihabitans maritimus]
MKELLISLREVMERQNSLVKELIELGNRETAALKKNDIIAVSRITKEQEILGTELVKAEQKRMQLHQELAGRLNLPRQCTLSQILDQNLPEGGEKLAQLSRELGENYHRLHEINELNKLLIRQSLALVNRLLTYLHPQHRLTYRSTGEVEVIPSSTLNQTV